MIVRALCAFALLTALGAPVAAQDAEEPAPDPAPASEPAPESEPAPGPTLSDGSGRLFTWIAGGLAIASVATTVVLWAVANSEYDELEEECASRPCTSADVSGVDTLVTLTNVGIGVSIGLFAAALVLFIVEGPDSPDQPSVAVGVGPGSLLVRGRF